MITLRNVLTPLLFCVAATGAVDFAGAQRSVAQGNPASTQFASAEAIIGTRSIADLARVDLQKIRAILNQIVKDHPESDMAAHILLEDKVGTIDVAALDRQIALLASGSKSGLTKPVIDQSVDAALAAAMAKTTETSPPLTATESSHLLSTLRSTWIIDPGAPSANVTVTVDFSLTPDGSVIPASIKLVSAQGGDQTAQQEAYRKARVAILHGSKVGFGLPLSKYQQWRSIEMVFDPKGMILR